MSKKHSFTNLMSNVTDSIHKCIDLSDSITSMHPITSITRSLKGNFIEDTVIPIKGSILHCSLFGAEHTGVYIGDGKIVELLGTGKIRVTDRTGFTKGTNALSIYVACNGTVPLGSTHIAGRAKRKVNLRRNYKLLSDNCHQFTAGCITDIFENDYNQYFSLQSLIRIKMNSNKEIKWRVWA